MNRHSIAEPPVAAGSSSPSIDEIEALRERVTLLEDVIRCLPAGLIITDEEQRIVACNPLADQIRGVGQRVGQSVAECHPERSRQALDAVYERFRSGPIEKQHPIVIERSNGWQVHYARISREDGSFRGIAWLANDIARLKRLEEQLVHQERIAGIGRMAAKLAHEIKNPLNIMAGALHNIRRDGLDEEAAEMVSMVGEQLERIRGVVDHLREVTRPLRPQVRPTSLRRLLRETVKAVGIPVELSISESVPEVTVDPELVQRLLVNALDNAHRSAGDHGTLTIRARVDTGTDGEWLILEVEDDGPGFPEAVLDHLFEPFLTTRPDGTGLGLVIMREVCRLHRGELSVENLPDGGACVTARLAAR
jgi:PAS domain S-box-containing protein